jgi:ankyrin repeat protein
LHDAAASKYATTELIELLIQNGADVSTRDAYGATPLHEATTVSWETVQLLLRHGADKNAQNKNGNTPIALAVRYANAKSFAIIRDAGADLTTVNLWGYNILHQAAYGADLLTMEYLASTNLSGVDPNLRDEDGQTPWEAFSTYRIESMGESVDKAEEQEAFKSLIAKVRVEWTSGAGAAESSAEMSRLQDWANKWVVTSSGTGG